MVNGKEQCTAAGVDLNDQAKTSARIADVSMGLGAVALIAGAYLYFTSPSAPASESASKTAKGKPSRGLPVNVSVGPWGNGAGASIQGVW